MNITDRIHRLIQNTRHLHAVSDKPVTLYREDYDFLVRQGVLKDDKVRGIPVKKGDWFKPPKKR